MIELFNTREIAVALWIAIFSVWALKKADIRKSFGSLIRAFCRLKILASVLLMFVYVTGIVILLATLGMWKCFLLKDTIVWFIVVGIGMMIRFMTDNDSENVFRKIVADNIKIVILLEFLANIYTFPLAVELVLVPLLTLLAALDAFASMGEEHVSAAKFTKGLLVVAGLLILGAAIYQAFMNFQTLKSLDTLRSLALAPLLSILMFPFIYIMLVFSKYEVFFIGLKLGPHKSSRLKWYAHRRTIACARFSLKRIRYLRNNHMVDLRCIKDVSDVDQLLEKAYMDLKRCKNK